MAFLQYVSTSGNDGNDGRDWAHAKATISVALDCLASVGGGELHYEDGVTGNFWFRGDGLSVTGFHPDVPIKVVGHGAGHEQFGMPAARITTGTGLGGGRLTPSIWIVQTGAPKEFHNIIPDSNYCNQFVRMWDFRRNADGSIATSGIGSWVRSGTASTLTLTLLPGLTITQAQRTSSTVTLTFTIPASTRSMIRAGQWIRVNSTDADFPSGDFVALSAVIAVGPSTGTLTYTQSNAYNGTKTNIGNLQSHDLKPFDRLEVFSTNTDIPSTAYRVLATGPDAVTVTVQDVYGGWAWSASNHYATSGTWSTPGTWVPHDRFSYASSLVDFYNIQATVTAVQSYDRPEAGPCIDVGTTQDGRLRFYNTALTGYVPVNGCPDPDRSCWMLLDGGGMGATGCEVSDSRPNVTGIRMYGPKNGSSTFFRGVNVQGDNAVGVPSPPAFELIEGDQYTQIYLDTVVSADNPGYPSVKVDACQPGISIVRNCGQVEGSFLSLANTGDGTTSARAAGQWGFSAGSVIGDLPHARRADMLSTARYQNLVGLPGTWTLNGGSASATKDPFGGNRAYEITGSGAGGAFPMVWDTSITPIAGDYWVFGTWIRRAGGWSGFPSAIWNFEITTDYYYPGSALVLAQMFASFLGDGEWQWLTGYLKVPTVVGTSWTIRTGFLAPNSLSYYGTFIQRIPASDGLSVNEASEYIATLRQQATYLSPGSQGTMDGVPFVAHGGLGVNATNIITVGASSGQATLGSIIKVMPLLAADGSTIIGYLPVYNSTINP